MANWTRLSSSEASVTTWSVTNSSDSRQYRRFYFVYCLIYFVYWQ
jgi:hypothetical protein